ncbi:MAG TPA: 5-formyltetrahydrofolate cyclo-ligase [Burkholderiaceae bacterium]|nr:5-formyltetrahydrofolate cyclo-ligase [Burkholderiaceae bacterium]
MDRNDESRISRDPSADPPRESLRRALIEARRRSTPQERRAASEDLAARLEAWLGDVAGESIAAYWPIRGEPDLGALFGRWAGAGARLALPVVDAPRTPLRFVAWHPGEPTVPGPHGIPRPPREDAVRPSVLVVPCVGFDARGYRLGYGGGFYDRTLAALAADGGAAPRAIGVAWDDALLETFDPLPTDVPLEAVVTPTRVLRPGDPGPR